MPDPDPTPVPVPAAPAHSYSWQQLARDIITLIQVVALAYVARIGTTVENRQAEVKQTLEVKAKDDAKATKVQLWNAWKQLEWIAEESGKQKDKDKAAEAKVVYDQWIALMNGD